MILKTLVNTNPVGTPRNNFTSSCIGAQFTTAGVPIVITSLARWNLSGNVQSHTLSLANTAGTTLTGITLNTSGGQTGTYNYVNLPIPIVLAANTTYYIGSSETNGGDYFVDSSSYTWNYGLNPNQAIYNNGGTSFLGGGSAGQSYVGINALYFSFSTAAETKGTTNEITFTPWPIASGHLIQSSTGISGPFSTIGVVSSGSLPIFVDNSPTSPVYYQVVPVISGVNQTSSVVFVPNNLSGTNLPSYSIYNTSQNSRHNLLQSGQNYGAASIENLSFSLVSNNYVFAGPYSPFVICNETFASGLGGLNYNQVGGGTTTVGSGKLTYSAGSQTTVLWLESGVTFVTPQMVVGATISGASNAAIGIGIGSGANNRLNVEWNSTSLALVGVNNGSSTTFGSWSLSSGTGPISIALEILHDMYNVWTNIGTGWSMLGGYYDGGGGTFDMRNSSLLSGWKPMLYTYGAGAGAFNVTFTQFESTYFNGPGCVREIAPVTNLDGGNYIAQNGRYWITVDRATVVNGSYFDASTSLQIHEYNPSTKTIYPAIILICGTFGGVPAAAADAKITYDHKLDGFHILTTNWCAFDSGVTGARIYYAFVPRSQFYGIVNVVFNLVTIPTDTSNDVYGPDLLYFAPYWYMVITEYVSAGNSYRTRVVKGTGIYPNNFSTNVVTDTSTSVEGVNFARLGSKVYVIGGTFNYPYGVFGQTQVFDFSDLTNLVNVGYLDVPNPDTTAQLPQQPALLWYQDGSGNGVVQYMGFQDNNYQGQYPAAGSLIIAESTTKLNQCWQFPNRYYEPSFFNSFNF